MDVVKNWFLKDVDFEFVPLGHVFLHYVFSISTIAPIQDGFGDVSEHLQGGFNAFRKAVTKRIFEECRAGDGEDGESLKTLFNILDPRGRTFIHAAYELNEFTFLHSFQDELRSISPAIMVECLNARDGAGCSIFHLMAIRDQGLDEKNLLKDGLGEWFDWYKEQSRDGDFFLKKPLSSPQNLELNDLKQWCFSFKQDLQRYRLTAFELAILVNATTFINLFFPLERRVRESAYTDEELQEDIHAHLPENHLRLGTLQLAALLGRAEIIEHLLEHHKKYNSIKDLGLTNGDASSLPAIHCAAKYGQVEAIQSILKFSIYDPMVQHQDCGTALHLLLNNQQNEVDLDDYYNTLLCHTLPNSWVYKCAKTGLTNDHSKQSDTPMMYSSNEISCINLLLQADIDVWTLHFHTKELPSPGIMANDEARKWWFGKVVSEVVVLKTSVSYAANATLVVAALVATASFIGPFQPPLGYGDVDGFVRTSRSPLRVYLVCNSLSFYFSIASILMAVLPAIPMPK